MTPENKTMKEYNFMDEIKTKKNPYRFLVGLLVLLLPFVQFMPYIAPAVLMPDMVASYNIGYGLAGLTITIVLAAFGVCMFFGSAISDRLGARQTIVLGVWLMLLGNVICWLSPNIALFMTGRILAAAGQGIALTNNAPYYTTWFDTKERTYLITINGCMSPIAIGLSLALSVSIKNAMGGSWNSVFLVYSIGILVVALLWTFLSKPNPDFVPPQMPASAKTQAPPAKQQSALVRALKVKQYWMILVIAAIVSFSQTVVVTYLFTYLSEARHLEMGVASTLSSVNSFVGVFGSLLGGTLIAQTGRRKPFINICIGIFVVSGLTLTMVSATPLIVAGVIVLGMSFYMMQPAQSNLIIESPEPFDPTILSGAFAMIVGTAQIGNLLVSPFFSAVTASVGMDMTFRITFFIAIIPMVLSFFLRETGKHAKKKAQPAAQQ